MTQKSKKKYFALRARLLRRGHDVSSWAKAHNYPVTSVYSALSGQRNGRKSQQIRTKVHEFLQTDKPQADLV